eukprot:COSAG01_NODE_950_length_12503_cov_39.622057_1_plen_162_part_10
MFPCNFVKVIADAQTTAHADGAAAVAAAAAAVTAPATPAHTLQLADECGRSPAGAHAPAPAVAKALPSVASGGHPTATPPEPVITGPGRAASHAAAQHVPNGGGASHGDDSAVLQLRQQQQQQQQQQLEDGRHQLTAATARVDSAEAARDRLRTELEQVCFA